MRGHGFLLANYVPGDSVIHRCPLLLKFLLVFGCGLASFLIVDWLVSAAVLAVMCGLYLLTGAGPRRLLGAIRPLLLVLPAIGLFQWWQLGGPTAARIVLNILVCIVAASLLTATTPMQRLLDGVVSLATPFRRFGADPERFALTIAVMLRSVPYIAGAFADVRDSARARGLERNRGTAAVRNPQHLNRRIRTVSRRRRRVRGRPGPHRSGGQRPRW